MMSKSKDMRRCSETDPLIEDTSMNKHDSPKRHSGSVRRCSRGNEGTPSSTWNRRGLREESARLEAQSMYLRDILKELKAKNERVEVLMPGFLADTQGPIKTKLDQ
ncbi:unnamed protein product [Meganyctiphanes norvegica]|uniref:Uncharacterized protein n=1 Tax=Meganyctiphanes norvegica TaxID=48144 RepID=A0AAV2RHE0_MEGNR